MDTLFGIPCEFSVFWLKTAQMKKARGEDSKGRREEKNKQENKENEERTDEK